MRRGGDGVKVSCHRIHVNSGSLETGDDSERNNQNSEGEWDGCNSDRG